MIDTGHNLGFSKANNIAIRQSKAQYVLLLNPDTFVAEDAVKKMLDFADSHPKAGGIGVRMHNDWGSLARESRRGLPSPMTSFYKMVGLCRRKPTHPRYGKYYMGWLPWDSPQQIEVISGACFLLRRKALDEVGLLDEDFFMSGEDVDLSYRLLKGGWENWYVPADIVHYKGESTQKTSFKYVHVFYNAMLIFMRKHYSHLSWIVVWPLQLAVYFIAFLTLVNALFKRMRKSLGFSKRYVCELPTMYFIGNEEMKARCREIAVRRGIECVDDLPNNANRLLVVVYDAAEHSYKDLVDIMEKSSRQNVRLGIYHKEKNIIITPIEVYG